MERTVSRGCQCYRKFNLRLLIPPAFGRNWLGASKVNCTNKEEAYEETEYVFCDWTHLEDRNPEISRAGIRVCKPTGGMLCAGSQSQATLKPLSSAICSFWDNLQAEQSSHMVGPSIRPLLKVPFLCDFSPARGWSLISCCQSLLSQVSKQVNFEY